MERRAVLLAPLRLGLPGERPRRSYAAILALALVGLVIAKPLAGGRVVGNLVAVADAAIYAAIYAAMVTYLRHEGRTESDYDIPWQMMVAALVLAPSPLLSGPGEPLATIAYPALGVELPVLPWAAGLGIVSTGVAYLGIAILLASGRLPREMARRRAEAGAG